MVTMILISSVALLVGILGSALIWGMDAARSAEIERTALPLAARPALARAEQRPIELLGPSSPDAA